MSPAGYGCRQREGRNVFTTNEQKLDQMIADPPVILDSTGKAFTFLDAEEVLPNDQLPNGGIRCRYRLPSDEGTPGSILEFIFKNPPQRRFSFGFKITTAVK
jgi:hypothetical protein